jgi:hypothetical protein
MIKAIKKIGLTLVLGTSLLMGGTYSNLKRDIRKYKYISKNTQHKIVSSVIKESKRYNINPYVLYSVLYTESTFRPWLKHQRVKVKIGKRRKTVRAAGLGGIIWEFWGHRLKKRGIAYSKSDLYNPVKNIKATAYVLNYMRKQKRLPGTSSREESMLRRFYGGNHSSYSRKVYKKVRKLTSR